MKDSGLSQRQLRVGELVRHAISDFLVDHTFADAALSNKLVSVTQVLMSPDLKVAKCYVSITDSSSVTIDSSVADSAVSALGSHTRYIRGRISPFLRGMKYMPDLRFFRDTSYENYARIDELLKTERVKRDLG